MQAQTVSAFLCIYFTSQMITYPSFYEFNYFCKITCHFLGPEGVARGEDALTMLENPTSRSQFIDELMEVKIMIRSKTLLLYLTCFILR